MKVRKELWFGLSFMVMIVVMTASASFSMLVPVFMLAAFVQKSIYISFNIF